MIKKHVPAGIAGVLFLGLILAGCEGGGGGGAGAGAAYPEVIYVAESGNETSIRTMELDGTDDELLLVGADVNDTVIRKLAVSNDRNRLVYYLGDQAHSPDDPSNTGLLIANAGSTATTKFSNQVLLDDNGWGGIALSPDGGRLAYAYLDTMYLLRIGASTSQFTSETTIDGDPYCYGPTWSHDGVRIAFVSIVVNAAGTVLDTAKTGIYTVNAGALSASSITPTLMVNIATLGKDDVHSIAWSPVDPNLIAVSCGTSSAHQIYLWDNSANTLTRINDSIAGDALNPLWSTDGESIFFEVDNEIYRVSVADHTVVKIKGTRSSLQGFDFRS